jgi:hypothetical protein
MENISKSLELLKLPEEFFAIDGQINKKVENSLVEYCVTDFTKMVKNPVTGKLEPTKTSTFKIESTESLFGAYAFNLASTHIHMADMDVVEMTPTSFKLYKPYKEFTTNGLTYWIGWSEVNIIQTATGWDYVFTNEQGMNTTMAGPVPHDENIVTKSILRKDFIKTSSVTPTSFSKSYPKYTIAQLKQKTGMSDVELAKAFSWTWKVVAKDDNTNCLSLATDIVINNNQVTGEVYINGIISNAIQYRTLTASYGQKLPGFVTRWKLYHPSLQTGMYGAAWSTQMASTDDTTLNLVKGTSISYDSATKTLTYLEGSSLVFDFEFLPAQGKNETWGTELNLDTFATKIYGA